MTPPEKITDYTDDAARRLAADIGIPLADAMDVLEEFRRAEVRECERRLRDPFAQYRQRIDDQ